MIIEFTLEISLIVFVGYLDYRMSHKVNILTLISACKIKRLVLFCRNNITRPGADGGELFMSRCAYWHMIIWSEDREQYRSKLKAVCPGHGSYTSKPELRTWGLVPAACALGHAVPKLHQAFHFYNNIVIFLRLMSVHMNYIRQEGIDIDAEPKIICRPISLLSSKFKTSDYPTG